jgi:hypothetical protein
MLVAKTYYSDQYLIKNPYSISMKEKLSMVEEELDMVMT